MKLVQQLQKSFKIRNTPSRRMCQDIFCSLSPSAHATATAIRGDGTLNKSQGSELLGSLIFYNIVILEAMKAPLQKAATSSSTGDFEHIAVQSLTFLTTTLDVFRDNLFQLRIDVNKSGRRCRVLEFLQGPYLAQLIQSCLQLSQHR